MELWPNFQPPESRRPCFLENEVMRFSVEDFSDSCEVPLDGSDASLCCTDLRDMDDTLDGRGASLDAASFISRKPLLTLVDCLTRGTGIVTGAMLLFVRPVTTLSSVSVSLLSVGKVSTANGLGLV